MEVPREDVAMTEAHHQLARKHSDLFHSSGPERPERDRSRLQARYSGEARHVERKEGKEKEREAKEEKGGRGKRGRPRRIRMLQMRSCGRNNWHNLEQKGKIIM